MSLEFRIRHKETGQYTYSGCSYGAGNFIPATYKAYGKAAGALKAAITLHNKQSKWHHNSQVASKVFKAEDYEIVEGEFKEIRVLPVNP